MDGIFTVSLLFSTRLLSFYLFIEVLLTKISYETTEDDYCLRGYCTVYKYYKWDKLIHDGIRARISQFVILPPFQHQGHGSQLYNAIVSTFLKNPKILDFTVEDASEAFDSLRDHCDYKRLLSMGIFSEPDFHPSLSRQWINSKIAETKLTQVRNLLNLPCNATY